MNGQPVEPYGRPGRTGPIPTVGLMLLADDRKLLVDELVCLEREAEETIRSAPVDDPVQMTLYDWDVLKDAVAAEANCCSDSKRAIHLHRICDRIDELLDSYR